MLAEGTAQGTHFGGATPAVFLSFILPGAAEPPRKGKEGPWGRSWEQPLALYRPPAWSVPSAALHGSSQGSPRLSTAQLRGQALFQLATAFPARLKAVYVQGSCFPGGGTRWLRSAVPSSPSPGMVGTVGGTEPQPLGGPKEKGRNLTPINHPIVPAVGIIGFANAIAAAMRKSDWKMY